MNTFSYKKYRKSILVFILFMIWTFSLRMVDRGNIGPEGSVVGFSTLNLWFKNLIGTHLSYYYITDGLSIIPLLIVVTNALKGLKQLIERKSLKKMDKSILSLGFFYIAVFSFYITFEKIIINYRPVLIDGILEVSYPSSTTLLVMTVFPTALYNLEKQSKKSKIKSILKFMLISLNILMFVFRVYSGVHWFSDIVGGLLLSYSLVVTYITTVEHIHNSESQ